MPDPRTLEARIEQALRSLERPGRETSDDHRLELLKSLRGLAPEAASALDRQVLRRLRHLAAENDQLAKALDKIEGVVRRLTQPPWHPAVLLGIELGDEGPAALVLHGNTRRVVGIAEAAEASILDATPGDEILLAHDLNVALARSPYRAADDGDTATFDRRLADGRVVVRSRDEEVVLHVAGSLDAATLRPGDAVRWRREAGLALERIERTEGLHHFLEETPADRFDEIGGLDTVIERLQWTFLLRLDHADTAGAYGVRLPRSVLLSGKPGNGKTKLARALARWLADRTPAGRTLFMNIKPSGLHSMWHGQSEANYREAFRVARAAAEREGVPVVMFFDEVDASGAMRGGSVNAVDDRVASSFMAELDGLEARGDVFVVAATNRTDIMDAALTRPGRLGDLQLHIPRPDRAAGRAILGKYLTPELPFAGPDDAAASCSRLIDAAIARIYAPNGQGVLRRLTLRSGRKLEVRPADLVSGALLSRVAAGAAEAACRRSVEGGGEGISLPDVLEAADEGFAQAARLLTPRNCRHYLDDLPQDDDVVGIEAAQTSATRSHRYLRIA